METYEFICIVGATPGVVTRTDKGYLQITCDVATQLYNLQSAIIFNAFTNLSLPDDKVGQLLMELDLGVVSHVGYEFVVSWSHHKFSKEKEN